MFYAVNIKNIKDAEEALEDETDAVGKDRDMSQRVSSYILMEVEREKLDENVIFCDYTTGKYNLVLFVTGKYFDEIDGFINNKVINLDGVLKVKEYPIVSLFEM